MPTSPADSRPPSRSANVTSAIISVGHQTGPGRDDSEDTIGVKTVTITLQVGGVCFILIIIATVCVVFFHELRTKNNRLHSPNTDAQRTDNGSRAQHNRHSNSILPKRRQAENTISIDRDPDAADPDAPYPGAHTADPGYDTGADCETESKTDDLLTFDKFGYDGVMVETDAENPIDSLAASVVEDNLSDMQTVVIKPDTPPSTAEDDDAASGFESYYAYSRASTYTTPIVR